MVRPARRFRQVCRRPAQGRPAGVNGAGRQATGISRRTFHDSGLARDFGRDETGRNPGRTGRRAGAPRGPAFSCRLVMPDRN